MKLLLVLSLVSVAIQAQTKDSLRAKYGEAVCESYLVRPEILVTVYFERDGHFREMVITPKPASGTIKSKPEPIKYPELENVIDELVPKEARGKLLIATFLTIICLPTNDCMGSEKSYERITIYYNAGKDGANYAVIKWKPKTSAP